MLITAEGTQTIGLGVAKVAVVGAGTMGHGIAHVAAQGGYTVALTDAHPGAAEAAMQRIRQNLDGGVKRGKLTPEAAREVADRIQLVPTVEDAARGAYLVVEAIVERLDAKQELFRRLDAVVTPDTLLASNTSSLSIARIAQSSAHPERVLGMHFFNPVHLMKLVEVVEHAGTAPRVTAAAVAVARAMGKEPIVVRDSPGFASSRLGVVLGLEAMRMVEQGVATAEDIDKAMELGYGHPMGPLRVSDLVGLDVRLAIAEYLYQELKGKHYKPPAILRGKVKAGELGKKTGKGFYQWPSNPS
ncbi:MAG TPA: 3-hydroxyacyl-CoA dehydrogenase family protein [Gemmatimonadales bacterium]|nr:3-hydroxyacyl-CoA dehydrogenase family protein [Gemmatimonadales bacterium]